MEYNGPVLLIGRLFILGFMGLLMWAVILVGLTTAIDVANYIAIYAYYSLVLGVALIGLSSWGRREMHLGGKTVERSSLDLRLISAYRFLLGSFHVTRNQPSESILVDKETMSELLAIMHELLSSMVENQSRLDSVQQMPDKQLEEIRKKLARIEEKLGGQIN